MMFACLFTSYTVCTCIHCTCSLLIVKNFPLIHKCLLKKVYEVKLRVQYFKIKISALHISDKNFIEQIKLKVALGVCFALKSWKEYLLLFTYLITLDKDVTFAANYKI